MSRKAIHLLDVRIDDLSLEQAIDRAGNFLRENKFHQVVTPGPEFLLEATANAKFRDILNRSDLSIPDGVGLKIGAWLKNKRLVNRVAGVDFVYHLFDLAQQRGARVFLFGSRPGVLEAATREIWRRWPGLAIVGYESGYRGWWQKLRDHQLIEKIHRAKPDILLVALGAPKQELWIDRHRRYLHDVKLAIGVGRTFDYLAGAIKRPPALVRRLGLEWLYTYLFAGKFYQPEMRRQRVGHATWHFLKAMREHDR